MTRLTAQLEDRSVNALSPIGMTQAPSEVHALVQAINGLLDEVERSVHQEKRFLDDAAHQLRTPLAGLISQVELAQQEASDPALAERLAKVHTGAQRSAHLVHQLLTLARSESQVRRAALDLAALARDVAREWTPRALAAGMDLGYEGIDHLLLKGDAAATARGHDQPDRQRAALHPHAAARSPCGSSATTCRRQPGR